jgi:hypothetical protein
MHIENLSPNVTADDVRSLVREMSHVELLAQEITQKAALHALVELRRRGITEANVRAMIESLSRMARIISAECKRRGVATVDHPGSN